MINRSFINDFKNEIKSTRRMLDRLPFDKWDWKPHEKSMTLGRLANHVVDLVSWAPYTINHPELDLGADYKSFQARSKEELMKKLDDNAAEALQALENASDETMMADWSLKNKDRVYFTLPRVAVLRSMVFNHIVHHRGQLSVYLRLLDVPVPGMYGPTADEAM